MWDAIFNLGTSAPEKILRSALVYLFLVLAFRVFGKRELGQATTLDFVVLLLIANAVQNALIGDDISVTGALLGALVLFVLNRLFAQLEYGSWRVRRLLDGTATQLIRGGHPDMRALRRELISLPELRDIARRQGFADLGEVESAWLETNGVVSMFRKGEQERYHPAMAMTAGQE